MVKFYDVEGIKKTQAWAEAEYGFSYKKAVVEDGDKVYRLSVVQEMHGQNAHITTLLDKDGNALVGRKVAFYWPDAPALPEVYDHDWYEKAHLGPTNAQGNCGNGMGSGAWVAKGACGPHVVWIHDANVPTDGHFCLGMVAGTNHNHLNSVFVEGVAGTEPEPPTNLAETFRQVGRLFLTIADLLGTS